MPESTAERTEKPTYRKLQKARFRGHVPQSQAAPNNNKSKKPILTKSGKKAALKKAAEAILRENHLLVHPGYFYDMNPDHLVLSFVQHSETIQDAFPKLLKTLECRAGDRR